MGGGVVIGDPSEGGEESTIIFEATGFPTCTLNGITEGEETGGKGTEAANQRQGNTEWTSKKLQVALFVINGRGQELDCEKVINLDIDRKSNNLH